MNLDNRFVQWFEKRQAVKRSRARAEMVQVMHTRCEIHKAFDSIDKSIAGIKRINKSNLL